jgi:hypothetical protein
MLNFLYFLCGSNLRTIDNVNEKIVEAAPTGEISDELVKSVREYCFPPSMWDQRAERTLEQYGNLISSLSDALVAKNKSLLQKIDNNFPMIGNIKWTEAVQPLNDHEISSICAKHGVNLLVINYLIDKGYFCGPPNHDYLHPDKPADLYHHWKQLQARRYCWFPSWYNAAKYKADTIFTNCFTSVVTALVTEYAKVTIKSW